MSASGRAALATSGSISGSGLARAKIRGIFAIFTTISGFRTPPAERPRNNDTGRADGDTGCTDAGAWTSEIEAWALRWGEKRFLEFPTTSGERMFAAIRRFESDLPAITHDGCTITVAHMRNARKLVSRTGRTYTLGKPANHQKIDAAVTSVLAHEAASHEHADGWRRPRKNARMIVIR